jgi:hypothetical protein
MLERGGSGGAIKDEDQQQRGAAAGAKKLQELEEIRAMQVSVANMAAAEVNEVLSS